MIILCNSADDFTIYVCRHHQEILAIKQRQQQELLMLPDILQQTSVAAASNSSQIYPAHLASRTSAAGSANSSVGGWYISESQPSSRTPSPDYPSAAATVAAAANVSQLAHMDEIKARAYSDPGLQPDERNALLAAALANAEGGTGMKRSQSFKDRTKQLMEEQQLAHPSSTITPQDSPKLARKQSSNNLPPIQPSQQLATASNMTLMSPTALQQAVAPLSTSLYPYQLQNPIDSLKQQIVQHQLALQYNFPYASNQTGLGSGVNPAAAAAAAAMAVTPIGASPAASLLPALQSALNPTAATATAIPSFPSPPSVTPLLNPYLSQLSQQPQTLHQPPLPPHAGWYAPHPAPLAPPQQQQQQQASSYLPNVMNQPTPPNQQPPPPAK